MPIKDFLYFDRRTANPRTIWRNLTDPWRRRLAGRALRRHAPIGIRSVRSPLAERPSGTGITPNRSPWRAVKSRLVVKRNRRIGLNLYLKYQYLIAAGAMPYEARFIEDEDLSLVRRGVRSLNRTSASSRTSG
jgi:hypothetical protein